MYKIGKKSYIIITVLILLSVGNIFLHPIQADSSYEIKGFDKGPSFANVVPMEKVTFVNYDENTLIDDYSYLAALPTAIFYNRVDKCIFSNPLIFYQDEYQEELDKERSLNARQGINYFMEDWMSYSYKQLDKMTLINVPKSKLDPSWKAKEYEIIEEDNPYKIASQIAIRDWSYSDNAVIAVIGEQFEKPNIVTSSTINGTISPNKKIITITFYTDKLNKLNPRYHEFEVPEGYKYLKSRTWWASLSVGKGGESALPININVTIPAADPDSQLYCEYNGEWMQAAITSSWNIDGMDLERAETYVYKNGKWRLGITDIPNKGGIINFNGKLIDILRNMLRGTIYRTDITIFPGIEKEILIDPPFGCRESTFKLTWDTPDVKLGFSLIGPAGDEILSVSKEQGNYQVMHLDQLGECLPNENYSIVVYAMSDLYKPIDFRVEFNWRQNISKDKANALSSATEGAVLASILNAPLLYISYNDFSEAEKVLYKLGVKNIYLLDLGKHLSIDTKNKIEDISNIKEHYVKPEQVYYEIMKLTGQNDIVFSTIDPWTRWFAGEENVPGDETENSLFIGPAAYCAAHHGVPVLIVDNHPELSSSIVWHNEFWKRHSNGLEPPTVAQMYLTGKRVYDFLSDHGFDKEGEETMITIAGQFDIGATWDRVFVGKAKPGRFYGLPVDTSYWIARNIFYPALIFQNPAMNQYGNKLIQGSYSKRSKILPWGGLGLKITKPSQEETFNYPVLHMYVCHALRTNERFEKYYGFRYKTADDIVPGVTESFNPIDEGSIPGKTGAIWPDISNSEVLPFYMEKGGFGNVYSTNFKAITNNLNNGVLLWITSSHGSSSGGGVLLTWNPEESILGMIFKSEFLRNRFGFMKEENPWRGYEWYLGSTENPDTLTMEVHGLLPALLGNPNIEGLFPTGLDFCPSERPVLHRIFGLLNKIPILKWFIPEWLASSDYYKDGIVIATAFGIIATSTELTGFTLDDYLDNIHSCGWINVACLPAYKYMHLTMVRHGSSFQIIDPWSTSTYGSYWIQTIPRDIILGDTVGEAYMKGIKHVGILYTGDPPQWWWDIAENVCFFGDPDLRVFVPNTEYSNKNYLEKGDAQALQYDTECSIEGHMPFGSKSYPNKKEPGFKLSIYIILLVIILVLIVLTMLIVFIRHN